jgi:hypothetical protein
VGAVYGRGRPFGHPVTVVAIVAGTAGTYGVVDVAGIASLAGLVVKKPQPLAQTCQSTPACAESFVTAAFRFTIAPVCTCAGTAGTKLVESPVAGMIEVVEVVLAVVLAIEVALIVTAVPVAVTGGAV